MLANNGGIVCDAAKDLKISRTALYEKKKKDPEFSERWDEAVDRGIDVIEDEAKRRALIGVEEPVYYQGKVVGYIHRKSDYCLGMILKAHRRKYYDKYAVEHMDSERGSSANVVIYIPDNGRGPESGSPTDLVQSRVKSAH